VGEKNSPPNFVRKKRFALVSGEHLVTDNLVLKKRHGLLENFVAVPVDLVLHRMTGVDHLGSESLMKFDSYC
jgi:hypothetical protein